MNAKTPNSKKLILRKFKFSLGVIGCITGAFFTHQYLSLNYPTTTRKLYFDKFFNFNNNWSDEKLSRDQLVRIKV